ncbi:hypothetical protein PSE_0162 [Pseudovibrio sp. FO-BEG1]|nr:hypothetical protein PSE_0162 [Pseudovibrio sp. FO-BEG1]
MWLSPDELEAVSYPKRLTLMLGVCDALKPGGVTLRVV